MRTAFLRLSHWTTWKAQGGVHRVRQAAAVQGAAVRGAAVRGAAHQAAAVQGAAAPLPGAAAPLPGVAAALQGAAAVVGADSATVVGPRYCSEDGGVSRGCQCDSGGPPILL